MSKLLLYLQIMVGAVLTRADQTLERRDDERGSVTMEQVLWAVAVIVIVGIVVSAITAYVTSESVKIK